MTAALFFEAIFKYLAGALMMGLLLFLPAGTLRYPRGWLLLGVLLIPMFLAGLVMMARAPDLLRSRLKAREKQQRQQLVIKLSGLMFLLGFSAAGLGHRLNVGQLPGWVSGLGAVIFLICYALMGEVMRENTWLSRTVEVREGQTVVDTGLYGWVRHPMYAVTLPLFLSMPLILGSWISLLFFLPYPAFLVLRIRNEEQVLEKDLPGYEAYMKKVPWHLIPYIW